MDAFTDKNKIIGFHAPQEEYGYLSNWYPSRFEFGRFEYTSGEWKFPFSYLQQMPLYRESVNIYLEYCKWNFRDGSIQYEEHIRSPEWLEKSMRCDMGGGFPWQWFWEMKQDIYDVYRFER